MLNFTVGPVEIDERILEMGSNPVPYFRTPEFSEIMFENERITKKLFGADEDSRAVFLTTSGTGAMEAAVINFFDEKDKVLVVNGGGFGSRFCELCELHHISYTAIRLKTGEALKKEHLEQYQNQGYTGFLVNLHETSTGVLYDIKLIKEFCRTNNLFLVVDAISSFLADELQMKENYINVAMTGSQKALALPPGIAIIVMDKIAINRMNHIKTKTMYLDLKSYLKNGERGQTPFTPAVSILLQMNMRLKQVEKNGLEEERKQISMIAEDFRNKIKHLPLKIVSESLSNAVTPLSPTNDVAAFRICQILKDEYGIWLCPNGGDLAEKVFRVGHIGALTTEDNTTLIEAFDSLVRRKIL
ncbi:MAG: alanine--glyoxylate aminotransferase family protein [Lachnospiraceae bacterium]|nr:alanine--glyoxylate aminotransferase family protein [Lachnospiraceae bacterium]